MITFLPHADFAASARVLDRQRLGKQRVEAKMILDILKRADTGLKNHPAVLMWRGYEDALKQYSDVVIKEWTKRGYKNTLQIYNIEYQFVWPFWLNCPTFHVAQQSMLYKKDPAHYRMFVQLTDAYAWPVKAYAEERYVKSNRGYYIHKDILREYNHMRKLNRSEYVSGFTDQGVLV